MKQQLVQTHKTQLSKLKEAIYNKIGKQNPITREQLISRIFPHTNDPYEKYYYEKTLTRMCHYLRKTTNYFIVNERQEGEQIYYILKTEQEYQTYKNGVKNNIKGLKDMIKKAKNHVQQKKWNKL